MKKEIEKLIENYKEQIQIQKKRAKKDSKFKTECFFRCTQLYFVIDDLEKIYALFESQIVSENESKKEVCYHSRVRFHDDYGYYCCEDCGAKDVG